MREQIDLLQQVDPWMRNAPKSLPLVKGCSSVNFTACSVCQKLGLYQRLPSKTPQYDIFSEEEERSSNDSNDEEWCPDEVDLNTVTIDNMTIDSDSRGTDEKRGRYREITVGAGESVVNPDDWPTVDLKPSKGSVKGTTRWRRHLKPSDIPRSQGPQTHACSVWSDRQRQYCGI